jgi:hypothetical protein
VASSGGGIDWDDQAIANRIRRSPARADVALTAVIERQAPRSEARMKTNAVWTDRTGNARQGLHAQAHRERLQLYAVVLAHTVAYGIWLEVAHGGRFRIVQPTMPVTGAEMMRDASNLFAVIFG